MTQLTFRFDQNIDRSLIEHIDSNVPEISMKLPSGDRGIAEALLSPEIIGIITGTVQAVITSVILKAYKYFRKNSKEGTIIMKTKDGQCFEIPQKATKDQILRILEAYSAFDVVTTIEIKTKEEDQ